MKRLFYYSVLACAFALPLPAAPVALINGHIVTVDGDFSIAEAMLVEGERIVKVGTNAEITEGLAAAATRIDLQGATVLPGLIDSHVHSTGASVFEYDHVIPEMETIADVLTYIRGRTALVPEGTWINLSQVFITRLREQRFPTRAELDEAAPKHPVVFRTGPDAAVNSLALSLSEITRDTAAPEGGTGRLEKDPATGEPTGILRGSATGLIKRGETGTKSPDEKGKVDALAELLADYNKVGLTSVSDRGAGDGSIALYSALRDSDRLTCRVYLYYSVNAQSPIETVLENIDKAAAHPLHAYNSELWLRGIKIFLDGGMLTGSAYMKRPWGVSAAYGIDDPEYRGMVYVEPEKLHVMARHALSKGLQFTAHSVGDGAVERLVDVYAKIGTEDFPVNEMRPCVTHCNFMTAEAIEKMATHGIVADLQPAWLYLDGRTLLKQFGLERLEYFQPYKTLAQKGVIAGGGSDHMQKIGSMRSVNPYNPFLGIWTTLTRHPRWMGDSLRPEQIIERADAIRLYTINNAWLTFEEKEKGSLEPGKLADFIVLDRDILTCPVEEVRAITVRETWLGGRQVYKAVAE
ncbi:MAG: amidohydrolase [Verrucomicrobiales bacterium]|jgi:predicted amidohydrolase YtcJ|nr:amidohydrolase [Verrucomicrobiales bacterium]MDP5007333.1 amidohydrolase [Verrucomicrobiales bacterium]